MAEGILDLVNEKDEVIGTAPRKEVNENGLLYRCAGIYVFSKNKIVLQKRSPNKKIRPSNWAIVEETVKSGETYEQAAKRGVKEELGTEPKNLKFIGKKIINDTEYPDYFIMSFYTCQLNGQISFDKDEVAETKLLTKNELKNLVKNNEKIVPSLKESIGLLP
ncbi:MAG: NUDIX domain-containing protein [archaeon]